MKLKFDSRQFGKILFIVYCFLLIPLVAMLIKTYDSLNQLVMNPGFITSEKIRGDFPKLIFIISFIFFVGMTATLSLFFYIRRNKHSLDFMNDFEEDSFDLDTPNVVVTTKKDKPKTKSLIENNNITKLLNSEIIDLEELVKSLCKELEAGLGALYLTHTEIDTEYLKFEIGYAVHQSQKKSSRILFGEGLTGQSALSKESILIKDINENNIKIYSGLGVATPKNLLITPLVKEDRVLGVLEIAGFKDFNLETKTQLEQIAAIISEKLTS